MIGASDSVIIWQHILPNIAGPIIVGTTLGVGNAIIIESSLSFLGLGCPTTNTYLGQYVDGFAGDHGFKTLVDDFPWIGNSADCSGSKFYW